MSVDVAGLLPHAGDMVLLEAVSRWGPDDIECVVANHRAASHPLRRAGVLPVAAALEYAAQALAVHARLTGQLASRGGFLAAVRDLRFHAQRLDDIDGPLRLRARCLQAADRGLTGEFVLEADRGVLASGRLTLMTGGRG